MKRLRLLWRVIRSTHSDYLIYAFVAFALVVAGLLMLIEPSITSYGDAVWYCFSVVTTIGFGDIVATTLLGRVLSIAVGLLGIIVIGVVIGVVVAYYNEIVKARHAESLEVFADKLEHLPELSHDELVELSDQVKRQRDKMGHPLEQGARR